MKKSIFLLSLLMTSAYANAGPGCSCGYPLDATSGQYSAFGITPFPTISGQTVSHTVLNTGGSSLVNYAAVSNSAATAVGAGQGGDITLPSSGIIAFEMEIPTFLAATPSDSYDEGVVFSVRSGTTFMANVALQAVHPPYYSGPRTVALMMDNGTQLDSQTTSTSLPIASTFRYGIYFNMSTRQMGYTINGVDKGYLSATIPSGITKVFIMVGGSTNAPSTESQLGKLIRASLVTEAAFMNQPYPSGAKDICGNSI